MNRIKMLQSMAKEKEDKRRKSYYTHLCYRGKEKLVFCLSSISHGMVNEVNCVRKIIQASF